MLYRDLERATKLILRFLFYASPIIYGVSTCRPSLHVLAAFNPLDGHLRASTARRSSPTQLDWFDVAIAAVM